MQPSLTSPSAWFIRIISGLDSPTLRRQGLVGLPQVPAERAALLILPIGDDVTGEVGTVGPRALPGKSTPPRSRHSPSARLPHPRKARNHRPGQGMSNARRSPLGLGM